MQFVIEPRVLSRCDGHPSVDPSPCPNPACRAPGWPLLAKPLNWPWAEHCWNCDVELR